MVLSLMEELLLLALREKGEKGRVKFGGVDLRYGLAAAALADLSLQGKIEWDKHQQVRVLEKMPGSDPLLNGILAELAKVRKPKKLSYWINTLGENGKQYQKQIIANLVTKGFLQVEHGRYLWVIPYQVYTQTNASAKYQVKHRLRAIVLAGEKHDEYAAALLSLAQAIDLLDHVFTVDEIKSARKRVQTLVQDDAVGAAVAEVLQDIAAAATAAALGAIST
jgi:hypothetical protein